MKCQCREIYGPLARYVKLRVAHAPGMPGTFSPPPTSKETTSSRSRHASRHVRHARTVKHVGIANPWWRGNGSRHSRRMCNPYIYASGKRPRKLTTLAFHLGWWSGKLSRKLHNRLNMPTLYPTKVATTDAV